MPHRPTWPTWFAGPDGIPYVLDRATKAVYRIGLKTPPRRSSSRTGRRTSPARSPRRRFLAANGQDLLILDSKNVLWRWRPADDTGKGTLTKVTLQAGASLGDDILAIDTYLRTGTNGLYNLYIVDPSEQQIMLYTPAADGSGFPNKPTDWLATARDVVAHESRPSIDGDMFVADGGAMVRYVAGKSEAGTPRPRRTACCARRPAIRWWPADRPGATGPSTATTVRTAGSSRCRQGGRDLPGAVSPRRRRSRTGRTCAAMYIIPGTNDAPATLVWLSSDGVNQSPPRCRPTRPTAPARAPVRPPPAARARAPPRPPRNRQEALTGTP